MATMETATSEDWFITTPITGQSFNLTTRQHSSENNVLCSLDDADGSANDADGGTNDADGGANDVGGGPQRVVSKELHDQMNNILTYVKVIFCILAMIANGLNVSVFLRQRKSSANHYLIAISCVDILIAGTLLVAELYNLIAGPGASTHWFNVNYSVIICVLYLNPVLQRIHYLLVMHVTIERLLVVVFPLKAKDFVFMRYPKIIIGVSIVTVAVFHASGLLRFVAKAVVVPPTNTTIYKIEMSDFFRAHPNELRAASTAGKVIFVYILLTAALTLNLLVVCTLKRHSKNRRQMKTSTDTAKAAKQEKKTTITIVTSSLVFIILVIPLNTASILYNLMPDLLGYGAPYEYLYSIVATISGALVMLSLSTDFMAYMTLSTSFRRTCFRLLHIGKSGTGETNQETSGRTQVSEVDTKY